VVTIRVEAVYRPLGRAGVVADLRAGRVVIPSRTPAQHSLIADVVAAEEAVPAEVRASGSVTRGSVTTQLPPSNTQNHIDTELSRYFVAGASGATAVNAPATRPEVNLSTASPAVLATLVGVDAAKAAQIVAARPHGGFANRDDFVTRMGTEGVSLLHSMVSTAHVRVVIR
jgi:type II secretory pathway component PulK